MADPSAPLEQLVARVLASSKYRHVSPVLVRRLGAEELGKRRNLKAAVKATKDRLHQVAGAYLARKVDYAAHLARLRAAKSAGDGEAFRRQCAQAMERHASSRERLPVLPEFYAETLGPLAPVKSILDVACGLNPLALPWMPVAEGVAYYACDIYEDMVGFLGEYLALAGADAHAEVRDVVAGAPTHEVEVALVLKTIPCLDQLDRGAGRRLLTGLRARYILVSFPVHSLCGVRKGMGASYEARFHELIDGLGWPVTRFEFPDELAFLVHTAGPEA